MTKKKKDYILMTLGMIAALAIPTIAYVVYHTYRLHQEQTLAATPTAQLLADAMRYYEGCDGKEEDKEQTVKLLKICIQRNDDYSEDAALNLINILAYDSECKHPHMAFQMARRLAEQGNARATALLAAFYAEGVGTKQDIDLAERLKKKAEKLGYHEQEYEMERIIEENREMTNKELRYNDTPDTQQWSLEDSITYGLISPEEALTRDFDEDLVGVNVTNQEDSVSLHRK